MTTPVPGVTAVIPAAGASRRFGSAKLLADVNGEPLLQHTLRALFDGGVPRVVLVAAPGHRLDVVTLVTDPRVTVVVNPDPDRGMFSSIQVALAALPHGHAALVLPADMPFVRPTTVATLMSVHRSSGGAVVAAYRGTRGHPVVIPADIWPPLLACPAETNLKVALADAGVVLQLVSVDDPGVLRDVDERRDLD